jgi:hypothetical protein
LMRKIIFLATTRCVLISVAKIEYSGKCWKLMCFHCLWFGRQQVGGMGNGR